MSRDPSRTSGRRRWWAAAASAALMLAGLVGVAAPARAATNTTVTLTFDDANADQVAAAQTLKQYGLKGTFYIVSGWVGQSGYMTLNDLKTLQANGNEIGGHTVNHPDLTTLSTDEVTRQICNDRVTLSNWGFPITSFAYPFAAANATTESIAKSCNYNSARGLGDVRSPYSCGSCEYAEKLPPPDPYFLAAPDEVESNWTLQNLKNEVTNAETHGGGWVILTFHHIDNTGGQLSITPSLFSQFVQWLAGRASLGTSVKTVQQALGGAVKPVVSGPGSTTGSTLQNAGLETQSSGFPSCWQVGGYGTNTAAFTSVSPGHSGTWAEQITMTNYANGDAKLLPTMDLGGCSPGVTAGKTYALGAWYKSTAVTQFALYYRNSSGGWVYWTSSPWFAASSGWVQAKWTTPAVPTGATGISFGLNIFSNGTLTTDDYAMAAAS